MKGNKMALKQRQSLSKIQDNLVLEGILSIMNANYQWLGTMTELNLLLSKVLKNNKLPGSPAVLRIVLNRITNRIRNRGIGVKFGRMTGYNRTRFVKFTR